MELGQHISHRYNEELEDIRSKVLKMGGMVESQAENAVKSLLTHDKALAKKVAASEQSVNDMEMEIDDDCMRVIARRQPTARDLRLVITVSKVITDLERIGDEADKIALYSKKLAKKNTITGMHADLTHLSELVLTILHNALDTFARMDDEEAMKILGSDKQVHREFDNLSRLLITFMMEDSRNIKGALRVGWCGRSLERIAEHAQNICEYVIFLVKGKDVRHTSLEHIRSKYFPQDIEQDIDDKNA